MAESILKRLGLTGTQYNTLRSLSSSLTDTREIISQARLVDKTLHPAEIRSALREFQRIEQSRPYYKSINIGTTPRADRIQQSVSTQIKRYSTEVKLTVYNKDTETYDTVYRNYASWSRIPKGTAADFWVDTYSNQKLYSKLGDTSNAPLQIISAQETGVTKDFVTWGEDE